MIALEQASLVEADSLEAGCEAQLIERLRQRDLGAFEELVFRFERPIYRLCYRLLGDAEEARDATQETFLKIYRGLKGFRGESGLKTWIYRIAINQAMNQERWWRRRHRDETLSLNLSRADSEQTLGDLIEGNSASPEEVAIANERERHLMRALGEMKAEYRAALILREIEELSYEEIAESLGISIGTVKSRIARGREELRRRLKGFV
jgi:RNA polymerase sigma-70 factor (ECF subfamily)